MNQNMMKIHHNGKVYYVYSNGTVEVEIPAYVGFKSRTTSYRTLRYHGRMAQTVRALAKFDN